MLTTSVGPEAMTGGRCRTRKKYLRVTNEIIRGLPASVSATLMEADEDPDNYIMEDKRIRSWFTALNEPVTDLHFTDIMVQGLPESYRKNKLTTYKSPDFDMTKIHIQCGISTW